MTSPLILSATGISIADVIDVARNNRAVQLSDELVKNLQATKAYINDNWLKDDAPLIYSLNTGVGAFKDQRVSVSDIAQTVPYLHPVQLTAYLT